MLGGLKFGRKVQVLSVWVAALYSVWLTPAGERVKTRKSWNKPSVPKYLVSHILSPKLSPQKNLTNITTLLNPSIGSCAIRNCTGFELKP